MLAPPEEKLHFTEDAVVGWVRQLHEAPSQVSEASKFLSAFQTSTRAWDVSIALLVHCAPHSPSNESLQLLQSSSPGLQSLVIESTVPPSLRNVVSFFAAQTLCALCQSGFESLCQIFISSGAPVDEVPSGIRHLLTELIYCYHPVPTWPAVRQLTHAVTASIIFSLGHLTGTSSTSINGSAISSESSAATLKDRSHQIKQATLISAQPAAQRVLSEILERYGGLPNLHPSLLEILVEIPQAVQSKRIALPSETKAGISYLILSQTSRVWKAIATIFDNNSDISASSVLPKGTDALCSSLQSRHCSVGNVRLKQLVLRCFASWFEGHSRYHRVSQQPIGVFLPPLQDAPSLLCESSVLPILLLTWELLAKESLSEAHRPHSQCPPLEEPNEDITVDLDIDETPVTALIGAAADALMNVLDYMYTLSVYAVDGESSEEPLISWMNYEPLLAIFRSLSRVNDYFRDFTSAAGTSKLAASEVPGSRASVDVRLIPPGLLKGFAMVMGKFAEVFLPAFVYLISCGSNVAESEGLSSEESSLALLQIEKLLETMVECLAHASLEFRHLVLDFWFAIVGHQFTQQQAQAEQERRLLMEHVELPDVKPTDWPPFIWSKAYTSLVEALMRFSMFPSTITAKTDVFPFDAWIKFRDEVAMNLTDTTSIIGCQPIIEKAGAELLGLLAAANERPSNVVPWSRIEVCLFVLTTVAPRAPAGDDDYIPKALEALPTLPYPDPGSLESVILSTGATRFILWTSGYIGTQRHLFARCFQMLAAFIPDLAKLTGRLPEVKDLVATQPEIHTFLMYTERVMIEAMNSLVTSGAKMLGRDASVPESDVTFVLNGLSQLALMPSLSIESRCSLIVSADALLQTLPVDRMQKYHYQLGKSLKDKLIQGFPIGGKPGTLPGTLIDDLKLFFVALESVKPYEKVLPPPPSANAVPLERSSEHRHPVLNVIEEFWPICERCLLEFHACETVVEYVGHCIIKVFSQSPAHAIRYQMFHSFLEALTKSFTMSPSVFHLGSLRSMIGLFGSKVEPPVQTSLRIALVTCTERILTTMKETGVQEFISMSPDIVGMTLDCTNTALASAWLSAGLLQMESFQYCLTLSIHLTPECHHFKVLMTMLVFIMRFVSWLEPFKAGGPPSGVSPSATEKWTVAARNAADQSNRLMSELDLINKICYSVMRTTTEVFQGNAQWIGIVGSLLLELLTTKLWAEPTKQTLRRVLNERPKHIVPEQVADEFLSGLEGRTATTHRSLCEGLQRLADQAEANWQKAQFLRTT